MLEVSKKLFTDINSSFDSLGAAGIDLSFLKAVCVESFMIKLAADFEQTLKRDLLYNYLAKDRDFARVILEQDSHQIPRYLKQFATELVLRNVISQQCSDVVQEMAFKRNSEIAHRSSLCNTIVWDQVPIYIDMCSDFLCKLQAFLEQA